MKNFENFLLNFRLNNYGKRFIFMLISVIVLLILFGIESLRAQPKTAPRDSVIESVKMEFPKVYGIIVRETILDLPNDSTRQNSTIKMQCYCFTLYMILMSSNKYPLPKEDFLNISMNVLLDNSKYPLSSQILCDDFKKNKQKLDCMLSEMVVNWIETFLELDAAIFAYNLHH